MSVIQDILRFLDAQGEVPALYGSYHLISLAIMVLLTVWFCKIAGKHDAERVRRVVFWTAIIVAGVLILRGAFRKIRRKVRREKQSSVSEQENQEK